MANTESRPHIQIDEDSKGADQLRARIQFIDDHFQKDPHKFLFALEELGGLATRETLGLGDPERYAPKPSRQPGALIQEYFRGRYDINVIYDDATQAKMKADPTLQEQIEHANGLRRIRRAKGVMGSEEESNPNAMEATNAVRRTTLGLYLGYIANFNEQALADKLHENYSSAM